MAQSAAVPQSDVNEPTLLGHPRGLFVLFFAELWERFCYYGMRALLAIYIAEQFFAHLDKDGAAAAASASYGGFTALVYALGIFGGTIADRVLGYRRTIIVGGLFMAAGEFMLMSPSKPMFFMGLAALIVGNGMFKPNISTLVGKLYKQNDSRRDSAFTIFYMGINIGALLAPLACTWISYKMGVPAIGDPADTANYVAAVPDYRYGFMLAGACMLLGLVCFGLGRNQLQGHGLAPAGKQGIGPIVQVVLGGALVIPGVYFLLSWNEDVLAYGLYATFVLMELFLISLAMKQDKVVRARMLVLVVLLFLNVVFWSGFEQAGNSLNFFAKERLIPLRIGTWSMPFEWWQSVNSAFIVLLGPIFTGLWIALDRRGLNPSIPAKFGIGLVLMGLGFAVLNLGISGATAEGNVYWYFLLGLYFVHTCGELCLSPVGLSMVTKLAPEKVTGMVMGAWFLAIACGNYIASEFSTRAAQEAGKVSTALEKAHAYGTVFNYVCLVGVVVGGALLLCSRWINRGMHGVK
ncbi:MAG: peptide MFS transporter [Planctomycetes bacterium]|nr:peptide MFS transporter [Planctomycetota bacterium]